MLSNIIKLTIFRKSTFLFSCFNPRSHAAVMIAFMATSTGTISAGKSGLQCIERTTPEANNIKYWFHHNSIEISIFFSPFLPRAAPIIRPVGPFMPSTQPGYGSFHAAVTVDWILNDKFHEQLNSNETEPNVLFTNWWSSDNNGHFASVTVHQVFGECLRIGVCIR